MKIEEEAEVLIGLKDEADTLRKARQELEAKLLEDSAYKELKEKEKQADTEYAEARAKFTEVVKAEGIDEKIDTNEGSVSVLKKRNIKIVDSQKLEGFIVKSGVELDKISTRLFDKKLLKAFVEEKEGLGEDVDGVELENDISIRITKAQ